MNIKNKDCMTRTHLPVATIVAFCPEPVERMDDAEIHRTILYGADGTYYGQGFPVQKSFGAYALQVALEAGVKTKEQACIESDYGRQLANGDVFIPLTMQRFSPTVGYIELFSIRALYAHLAVGTIIYMSQGSTLACCSSPATVMQKIREAEDFYDPNCLKHSKNGIPFVLTDQVPDLLPQAIALGNENESDLILRTEKDLCLADALCGHFDAVPPDKLLSCVRGVRKRLKPQMDQIRKAKEIRAQGIAAGNGALLASPPKALPQEDMVPRAWYEAEKREREKFQRMLLASIG